MSNTLSREARNAQPVRHVLVPNTRKRAREAVLSSFGFLHFVDTGERLVLHDGERRMEIDIVLSGSGDSAAGSPERVDFHFVGYTEAEADELVEQYLKHTMRAQDAGPGHGQDGSRCSHGSDERASQ